MRKAREKMFVSRNSFPDLIAPNYTGWQCVTIEPDVCTAMSEFDDELGNWGQVLR